MLNLRPNIQNKIKIQACEGGIYKSHPKSYFKRIAISSVVAGEIFSDNPKIEEKEIVVLQAVNFGSGQILVEIISKADYEAENINNENLKS